MVRHWSSRRGDQHKNFDFYAKVALQRQDFWQPRIKEALEYLRKPENFDNLDSTKCTAYLGSLECFARRTRSAMETGEMGWTGFYWFVREGYFETLLDIFRFYKSLKMKPYLKGEKPIKLKAIEFVQETCNNLRHVMVAFIKFGVDSVSHPHVQAIFLGKKEQQENVMNEDAVYESPSDFYANFIFMLLKGMLSDTDEKKAVADAGSSLLGLEPAEESK